VDRLEKVLKIAEFIPVVSIELFILRYYGILVTLVEREGVS
jgi:hypothetical protein